MFEKPFQKLVPRVSSGFPNTRKLILGVRPRAFISFLMFGNPHETLTLVFEILHLIWLPQTFASRSYTHASIRHYTRPSPHSYDNIPNSTQSILPLLIISKCHAITFLRSSSMKICAIEDYPWPVSSYIEFEDVIVFSHLMQGQ